MKCGIKPIRSKTITKSLHCDKKWVKIFLSHHFDNPQKEKRWVAKRVVFSTMKKRFLTIVSDERIHRSEDLLLFRTLISSLNID